MHSCSAAQSFNLMLEKLSKLSTLCNQRNIVNIRYSSLWIPILSDTTAADWQKETMLCNYLLNETFWAWKKKWWVKKEKRRLRTWLDQGSSLKIAPCDTVITKIWLDDVVLMSQNTPQPRMHKVWSRWMIYAEGATTWGTMQPWQSVRTLGPLLSVWKSAIRFLHLPAELKYWLVSKFVSVFPSLTGELHHGALIKFHDLFPKDCTNYPPYGVNLVSPRARGSPS